MSHKYHAIWLMAPAALFLPAGSAYGQDTTVRTPRQNTQAGAVMERSPGRWVRRGMVEHQQFMNWALRQTPAQRSEAGFSVLAGDMLAEASDSDVDFFEGLASNIVITLVDTISAGLQRLLTLLSLQNWLTDNGDGTADDGTNGDGTADDGTGDEGGTTDAAAEGVVAFLIADETGLTVGDQTTVRLFVEQRSPNAAENNGINSAAVNIEVSARGIVESQVPVNILAGWDEFFFGVETGTADSDGGIEQVVAGIDLFAGDRSLGIDEAVEVFNFTVEAVAAGTVELAPTNFEGSGMAGVADWGGVTGEDADYGTVTLVVGGR